MTNGRLRRRARRLLMRRDPVLGATIRRIGACGMASRQRTDHLTALVGAIVSQQLSTKAAATIFGRFARCFPTGRSPCARPSQALDDAALRGVGLSGAEARLPARSLRAHHGRPAAARRARSAARRGGHRAADRGQGIRPLDRRDVPDVPAASARRAAGRRPRHRARPCSGSIGCASGRSPKRLMKIGEAWRPYRSVACWYLWQSLKKSEARKLEV